MLQDAHTRTEKFHALEKADKRSNVRTRKRRTPNREIWGIHAEGNTSETDVPVGQGLSYPPQVFTDPKYTAAVPHIEEEEEQAGNQNFEAGIVNFAISVVRHIAGAILQIGKKGYKI